MVNFTDTLLAVYSEPFGGYITGSTISNKKMVVNLNCMIVSIEHLVLDWQGKMKATNFHCVGRFHAKK